VKAEGSTFLLTDGLLILYAPHIASSVPWYPVANPLPPRAGPRGTRPADPPRAARLAAVRGEAGGVMRL
jgi:hypothetical protein